MNIYWLANEEMKRLWEEMRINDERIASGKLDDDEYQICDNNCAILMQEIAKFRKIILSNLKDNDPLLQEKVAELALIGDTNER